MASARLGVHTFYGMVEIDMESDKTKTKIPLP